ncbi:MAG: hypothetical protein H0W08_05700 [Acidobacteria bacterium]|nr:hypothetical protein [Acidobacteriota bacterium]
MQSHVTLSATFRVLQLPASGALLFQPRVTAAELTEPVTAQGGAVVSPPALPATLRSSDGSVTVTLPPAATDRALTLRHGVTPVRDLPPPANAARGFAPFYLDATDDQGAEVETFQDPLEIAVRYSPEQLAVLGIAEANLHLFWFDPAGASETQARSEPAGAWTPLPTRIDSSTGIASAKVDHFSTFALSNGVSSSEVYVPQLQGFQVAGFTGAATYSLPIQLPSGPAAFAPQLALQYSSTATDGSNGAREHWQAPSTGKGWSLQGAGAIARNRNLAGSAWDHFTIVLGGRSFDIVRGHLLPGYSDYFDRALDHWSWHAVDENFTRVRALSDGTWQVWTPDGTRYDFTQQLVENTGNAELGTNSSEVYQWLLTQTTDTHANRITYAYQVLT